MERRFAESVSSRWDCASSRVEVRVRRAPWSIEIIERLYPESHRLSPLIAIWEILGLRLAAPLRHHSKLTHFGPNLSSFIAHSWEWKGRVWSSSIAPSRCGGRSSPLAKIDL